MACFLFKHVIIPLPIGFLYSIDNFINASVEAFEIKLKCGVSPLITQPSATIASNFFICLEITTGISNTPGTSITLKRFFLY